MRVKVSNICNNLCLFCKNLKVKNYYCKTYDDIIKELKGLKNEKKIILPCNFDTRDDSILILEEVRSLFHKIYLMTNCRMFYYKQFLMDIIDYIDRFYINIICDKKLSNDIYGIDSFEQSIIGIRNLLGSSVNIYFFMFINDSMLKDGLDYFIYKISSNKFEIKHTIHEIKKNYKKPKKAIRILCDLLKKQYPQCNFIPYYIISNTMDEFIDKISFLMNNYDKNRIKNLIINDEIYKKNILNNNYYNEENKFVNNIKNVVLKNKHIIDKKISKVKLKKVSPFFIPENNDEIRLFIIVKNESHRLDYFLKYYFKKGIDKVFVVDNNSTDNTASICSTYKNVYLFKTTESYSKLWNWMQILLENYGKNHWCVVVDIDEFLIYPYDDILTIKELCKYLEINNYNALQCLLLDMYSDKSSNCNLVKKDDNPLLVCNYFDKKYIKLRSFFLNYKIFKEFEADVFVGGVRSRIFGLRRICLSKVPLFKYNDNMYLAQGMHALDSAILSDIQGVVFHFKYLNDFNHKIIYENENKERMKINKVYQTYLKIIKDNPELVFYNKGSVKFKNWTQLVDLGMMKNSFKLRDFIKNFY